MASRRRPTRRRRREPNNGPNSFLPHQDNVIGPASLPKFVWVRDNVCLVQEVWDKEDFLRIVRAAGRRSPFAHITHGSLTIAEKARLWEDMMLAKELKSITNRLNCPNASPPPRVKTFVTIINAMGKSQIVPYGFAVANPASHMQMATRAANNIAGWTQIRQSLDLIRDCLARHKAVALGPPPV